MNELITALAFAWRSMDGRQGAPKYWNVYIYLGLLTILCGYVYLEYMTAWQALGIYAVLLTYILSGYRSLTTYWVYYHIKKDCYGRVIKLCEEVGNKKQLYNYRRMLHWLEKWYKADDKGFTSWHMSYRYVIAGCMICAILNTWSVPYLVACSVAGLLFPLRVRYWRTEASARLTEGVLGAVVIGGWTWLV